MKSLPLTIGLLLVGLSAAIPCSAAAVFTTRSGFDAVIAAFPRKWTVDFDSQAPGTPALTYDDMTITPGGLASDGETPIDLPPIATNAFPTVSGSNSLGVSGLDHQFLAGNSDRIVFTFSEPINAFGLQLIGNPSPTGVPAIPFWKLYVYVPGGFEAYSATTPESTLGSGNDVYFLGVASIDQFTAVALESNNDLAACYSFNCDDVKYGLLPATVTIPEAKAMATGAVTIADAVVSRVHGDRFNIATDNPLCGIAVLGTGAVAGKTIALWGSVDATADQERVIDLDGIIANEGDANPPGPFGMRTTAVGGHADCGLQTGLLWARGPNNIGLDAAICGKITYIAKDLTWMTVDDGAAAPSGCCRDDKTPIPGVKVVGAINAGSRNEGDFVIVRGSISLWTADDLMGYPLIRVANPGDIWP